MRPTRTVWPIVSPPRRPRTVRTKRCVPPCRPSTASRPRRQRSGALTTTRFPCSWTGRRRAPGPRPCIVHLHGGGMVIGSAEEPLTVAWRKSFADRGLVVVGAQFRNGGGRLGNHPFPAGLNDCASAVRWVHANRERLGVSTIVVSGESGGGNLSLATALKANREGWIDCIGRRVRPVSLHLRHVCASPGRSAVAARERRLRRDVPVR